MNAQPQKFEPGQKITNPKLSPDAAVALCDGTFFNFEDIDGTFPSWRAIAGGLAKQCRWNGGTFAPYYTAQHCCHMADNLRQASDDPQIPLFALLHDAHEIVLGDLITPAKRTLLAESKPQIRRFEAKFLWIMYDRLGRPVPGINQMERVKREDQRAFATEWRDLLVEADRPVWAQPPKAAPWPFTLKPWGWEKAEQEWLNRLVDLTARCNLRNPL